MRLKIKQIRKAKGVTQARLASEIGISQSYLAQIENGDRPLKAKVQKAIADALDANPAEIIDWDAPERDEIEELNELFDSLPPEGRRMLLDMARVATRRQSDSGADQ